MKTISLSIISTVINFIEIQNLVNRSLITILNVLVKIGQGLTKIGPLQLFGKSPDTTPLEY